MTIAIRNYYCKMTIARCDADLAWGAAHGAGYFSDMYRNNASLLSSSSAFQKMYGLVKGMETAVGKKAGEVREKLENFAKDGNDVNDWDDVMLTVATIETYLRQMEPKIARSANNITKNMICFAAHIYDMYVESANGNDFTTVFNASTRLQSCYVAFHTAIQTSYVDIDNVVAELRDFSWSVFKQALDKTRQNENSIYLCLGGWVTFFFEGLGNFLKLNVNVILMLVLVLVL